jgi:hypothetical protein
LSADFFSVNGSHVLTVIHHHLLGVIVGDQQDPKDELEGHDPAAEEELAAKADKPEPKSDPKHELPKPAGGDKHH